MDVDCARITMEEMFLDPRLKPVFATERGTLRSNKRDNKRTILGHEDSTVHKFVVQGLKRRAAAKISQRLEEAQKKALTDEQIDLEPTVNHVRSVYETICKCNLALQSYERMVTLQVLNGINMGMYLANYRILCKSTLFVLILYWWLHNTECSGEMWNYKFDATWQWKTTSRL